MRRREFFLRHPKRVLNLWLPFLGSGIRILRIADDYRSIDVVLKRRSFNQNYNGSHFGGSLFAMTDPFYPLMLTLNLGSGYILWDKAGSIRYRRPGITDVFCHFVLTAEQIDTIRATVDREGTHDAVLEVDVVDGDGNVIATAVRTIYIATKAHHKARLEARKQ